MQVSRNIVMEAHFIRSAHFTGITCTAYQRREELTSSLGMDRSESTHEQQLRFRCSTGSHNTSLNNFPLKVRCGHPFVCPFLATITAYSTIINLSHLLYPDMLVDANRNYKMCVFFFSSSEFSSTGLCDSPSYSVSS